MRSPCWHVNLASRAFRHIVCGFTFGRQFRVQFWPATLGDDVVKISYAVEPGEYRVIQNRTAPDSEYENDQVHMDILVIDPPETEEILASSRATRVNDDGTPGTSDSGSNNGSNNGSGKSGGFYTKLFR